MTSFLVLWFTRGPEEVASEARYPFQGPAAPNIQLPPIYEGFPLLLQSPYGSPKLKSLEKLPRCAQTTTLDYV